MDVPVSARENDPLYGYRLWTLSQQIQSKKGRQGSTPLVAAEAVLEAIKAALSHISQAREGNMQGSSVWLNLRSSPSP